MCPHWFKAKRRVVGVGLGLEVEEGGSVEKPGNLITADLGVGLKAERLAGFGGNANSVLVDRELTTSENLIWQWMELEIKANKVIKECTSAARKSHQSRGGNASS